MRMTPTLSSGLFFLSDYDLLLTLDSDHFVKHKDILDKLKVGTDIKFRGYIKHLGKASELVRPGIKK